MMAYNWVTFFRNTNLSKKQVGKLPATPGIESAKPVLISLDLDGTLIPWKYSSSNGDKYDKTAFLRYQHTLQDPQLKKDSFIVLNTARGLKATQELAPLLGRIPFDALAVNDSQQLYIKPKRNKSFHPIEANVQWLRRLTRKQADPYWRKELKGWSTTEVLQDIRACLPDLDFELDSIPKQRNKHFGSRNSYVFTKQVSIWKDPEKDCWAVSVTPDHAYLAVKRVGKKASPKETEQYAQTLGRMLKNDLLEDWPNINFQVIPNKNDCLLHVFPKNNSKATLVKYLANRRLTNRPKAIVSAGDAVNDIPLLSANKLGTVPNYPILVGHDRATKTAIRQKQPEHLEVVPWNQLHTGIEKQFHKIRTTLHPNQPKDQPSHPIKPLNRLA